MSCPGFANLKLAPPASAQDISSLVAKIVKLFKVDPARVPADYLDFLRRGNGGTGDLAEGIWIRFEGAGEVIKNTRDYCFHEVGLLLIGGDGFGSGYGINFKTDPPEYVVAGFVDINPVYLGATFAQFIQSVISQDRPLRPSELLAKPAAAGETGQVAQWKWKAMGPWFVVTPDGKRILAAEHPGKLSEKDLLTGATVRTYEGIEGSFTLGHSCRCGAISDDGRLAAAGWLEFPPMEAPKRAVATIHDRATGKTLRSIELGQNERIELHAVAFTPGGKELLAHTVVKGETFPGGSFATQAQVQFFNVTDRSLVRSVPVGSNPGMPNQASYDRPVALSPDGRFLASTFQSHLDRYAPGNTVIYDAANGQQLATVPGGFLATVQWSPDSKYLAVAAGWVTLYDAADFRPVLTLSHLGSYANVAFTPDGTRLVTADRCGLCVHRLSDGRLLAGWPTPAGTMAAWLHTMHLDPDGTTAVTADPENRILRVWRLPQADAPSLAFHIPDPTDSSERLASLPAHASTIRRVILAGGGTAALTAAEQGQVMVWDTSALASGQWLVCRRWQLAVSEPSKYLTATAAHLADDGSLALVQLEYVDPTGKDVGFVVALDPRDGQELGRTSIAPEMHNSPAWAGAVSPDQTVWLLRDGKILRWRPGGAADEKDPKPAFASDLSQTVVAVSHDGRLLAAGGATGIELFAIASGNRLATLPLRVAPPVLALAFAPDGRTLAAGLSGGGELFALDPTTPARTAHSIAMPPRKPTSSSQPPVRGIYNLVFSNDGRSILCTDNAFGNQFVTLIDVATGKKVQKFRPKLEYIQTTAFGPDSGHVVIAGNTWGITSRLTIWSITDGQCISTLESPDIVGHQEGRGPLVAVGTSGLWLVAGDSEGTLDVWRLGI